MAANDGRSMVKDLLIALKGELDRTGGFTEFSLRESTGEILEDIALAEGVLSRIRSRLNATRPINRLPTELLASIFSLCQNTEPWSLFPPATRDEIKDPYSWLVLTEVCSQWRHTALSAASLWTNIYLGPQMHNQKEIRDMFSNRARSAPMNLNQYLRLADFSFFSLSQSLNDYLLFAQQHSSHLQSLYLSSGGLNILPSIWEIFNYDYPGLRNLCLDVKSDKYDNLSRSLHRMFTSGDSSLERISLSYIAWPTINTGLARLTHLAIRNQAPELSPTYTDFLDVLQGCPLLQFLSLHDAGPLAVNPQTLPERTVPLDSLRRAEISWSDDSELRSPCQIVQCLKIPDNAAILLHSHFMLRFDELGLLSSYLPPKKYLNRISTLELRQSGNSAMLFQGDVLYLDNSSRASSYLPALASYFPNLSFLIFASPSTINSSSIAMFSSPTNFTKIRFVHTFNFVPFVEELCNPSRGLWCPSLTEIILNGTGLEELAKRIPLYRDRLVKYRKKESNWFSNTIKMGRNLSFRVLCEEPSEIFEECLNMLSITPQWIILEAFYTYGSDPSYMLLPKNGQNPLGYQHLP
ncbi:hypothetical protein CPB84DRAFT_1753356 [Gymnopilus junonius]|uniref:F-box domain-containing protein n=1 Tax=Gymnopilus junonius TaxID=109634 RepID=A0A9P5NAH9_GYMJU|nr:hypothetical protein CPB84DRAFT_1753356 [Gymnopilus junonius]